MLNNNIMQVFVIVAWAKLLQEECQQLQDSNGKLKEEANRLQEETEHKECE